MHMEYIWGTLMIAICNFLLKTRHVFVLNAGGALDKKIISLISIVAPVGAAQTPLMRSSGVDGR